MKTYSQFISALNNSLYSYGRFEHLLEQDGDCEIDGVVISYSSISTIRRFYNNTNDYNRVKISEMINNNIRNIDRVIALIREYEKYKTGSGVIYENR